jgi:transposase-like protein
MPPLVLSDDEVQQLQGIASSRSLPHSIVQRAQIVLACGAGETNTAIAKRMGLTGMTVGKWRKRYRELGLEGLHDELRPGRPRTYEDDQVAEVINRALQTLGEAFSEGVAHRWQHPVVRTFTRFCHRDLQNHGSPLAPDFLGAAAQAETPPLRGSLTATSCRRIPSLWRRSGTLSACT